MGLHQEVVAAFVDEMRLCGDDCAIVLIGSVAAGTERETSDLDLNLFFVDEASAHRLSPYVDDDNRWQLQVKRVDRGVRIDVAWETFDGLAERLRDDGPADCWSFSRGTILHDPHKAVEPLQLAARRWFEEHPEVGARHAAQYAEAKRRQSTERNRK